MANKFLDNNGVLYLWQKIKSLFVQKEEGKSLSSNDYTNAEKEKLSGIEDNANNYVHPTYTAKTSGFYKFAEDATGHVSDTTPVTKADITALGIPESDTTYDAASTTSDGLMTAKDKAKLDGIAEGANKYVHPTTAGNKHIPAGGTTGQILGYESSGTAKWIDPPVTVSVDDALSSTSANPVQNKVVNAALGNKINTSARGAKNGVASLDANGLVPSSQLPSYVDDVIEGYYYNEKFYKEAAHTTVITGESGKIYVDLETNMSYRYSGSTYVKITSSDMIAITNAELDTICV